MQNYWPFIIIFHLVTACQTSADPELPSAQYFPELAAELTSERKSDRQSKTGSVTRISPETLKQHAHLRPHLGRWLLSLPELQYVIQDSPAPSPSSYHELLLEAFELQSGAWQSIPLRISLKPAKAASLVISTEKTDSGSQLVWQDNQELSHPLTLQLALDHRGLTLTSDGSESYEIYLESESSTQVAIRSLTATGLPQYLLLSADVPAQRLVQQGQAKFRIAIDLSLAEKWQWAESWQSCLKLSESQATHHCPDPFDSQVAPYKRLYTRYLPDQISTIRLINPLDLSIYSLPVAATEPLAVPLQAARNQDFRLSFDNAQNRTIYSSQIPKGKRTLLDLRSLSVKPVVATSAAADQFIAINQMPLIAEWPSEDYGALIRVYGRRSIPHFAAQMADFVDRRRGELLELQIKFARMRLPTAKIVVGCPGDSSSRIELATLISKLRLDGLDFTQCPALSSKNLLRSYWAINRLTANPIPLVGQHQTTKTGGQLAVEILFLASGSESQFQLRADPASKVVEFRLDPEAAQGDYSAKLVGFSDRIIQDGLLPSPRFQTIALDNLTEPARLIFLRTKQW